MKIAIVHDWLNQYGGAERVLEVLHEMYPDAPIFTSMYEPKVMPAAYRTWDVRTSFMQQLPFVKKHHQPFLPLYPRAFETFDFSQFDVVLSNSSGFCHGIRTGARTCHINYCLTPPRYLWNMDQYLEREKTGGLVHTLLPLVIERLRAWDVKVAQRIDYLIGISIAVVDRIRRYYRREAALIYPPVDIGRFHPMEGVEDYFLIASRLIPYKRVDLAVKAFNELGLPLKIVGDGRDRAALETMAKDNIKFLGIVSERELQVLIGRCRAFLFPGLEDFGIAPVEAQAAGRPVIAFAAGGAVETVVNGKTGLFFYEQTPEALAEAVRQFLTFEFDGAAIRRHAESFDTAVFKAKLGGFIEQKLTEHRSKAGLSSKGAAG